MAIVTKVEEVIYHTCDICGREAKGSLPGGKYIEVNGNQKMVCKVCCEQLLGKELKEPPADMTRKERKFWERQEAERKETERLKQVAEEEGL